MLVLIRNRQRVVSREEIMKAVWPDSVVEENNLDQQIAALRRALGQSQNSEILIETVPRRGYRFLPEVIEERHEPGSPARIRLWRKNLAVDAALLGSYTVIGQGAAAQVRGDIIVQNTASGEITVSVTKTGSEATTPI
jgi:DNA-binding winged helix-turn-helix (wHTH) protein